VTTYAQRQQLTGSGPQSPPGNRLVSDEQQTAMDATAAHQAAAAADPRLNGEANRRPR